MLIIVLVCEREYRLVSGWKTVVRIGAINCYADDNYDVCEKHNIMAFPTLRVCRRSKDYSFD